MRYILIIFAFLIVVSGKSLAQQTVITGKVTDATTGEPIPYAKVYFKNLHLGATTTFEGLYSIKSDKVEDSLTVEYLGYTPKSKHVKKEQVQVINFQILSSETQMGEVTIHPGENPAFRILRGVWAHRSQNDKASLDAYQYKSYSKIEMSATNISDKFKNSALMRPFKNIFDSLKMVSGDDGKTIIPFFISETNSDVYYLKNPGLKSEHIRASKLSGVGLDDGSLVSQLMGSTLQDYNFYQNWMLVIDKGFISPIADGGISFYHYYLIDSVTIDGKYCYKIEFKPKQDKDLAFTGTMWINDTSFALKRIIVAVDKKANLNYIRTLHLQQDLVPTSAGPWLVNKERITVDASEIVGQSFGVLGKLYVANSNIVVNQPQKLKVYEQKITEDDTALKQNDNYWLKNRPDSLTKEDRTIAHIIDTIKRMPNIKTAADIAEVIINGYYTINKVDIGPYIYALGDNVVEGYRFRLGMRTNYDFSKFWVLKAYAAVGTNDLVTDGLKYSVSAEHWLSREHWTKIGVQNEYDVAGLGVADDFFEDNTLLTESAQLGLLTRLDVVHLNRIWIESDIVQGFNIRAYLVQKTQWPKGSFNFYYYPNPENTSDVQQNITTTEADIEARISFNETYIINGNRRANVQFEPAPIILIQYSRGIKDLFGGQFNYNKLVVSLEQTIKMGTFGHADYYIAGQKIFNTLPYPLLEVEPGNSTIFRTYETFNMMNFFEFVTDQSLTAFYTQHLDGIFFNRIPLLKKLKWREVVGVKAVWGSISPQNDINNPASIQYAHSGPYTSSNFYTLLPNKPYAEVSYGVENIFRFFRVDFLQRLNYLEHGAPQFAVKASFYFAF